MKHQQQSKRLSVEFKTDDSLMFWRTYAILITAILIVVTILK